jgi:hypothetical protein
MAAKPAATEPPRGAGGGARIDVRHRDPRALPGERARDGLADAAAPSGDQRDLISQAHP